MPFKLGLPLAKRAGRAGCVSTGVAIQKLAATIVAPSSATQISLNILGEITTPPLARNATTIAHGLAIFRRCRGRRFPRVFCAAAGPFDSRERKRSRLLRAFAGTTDSGRTPPTRAGHGIFRGARAVDPRSAGG